MKFTGRTLTAIIMISSPQGSDLEHSFVCRSETCVRNARHVS